MATDKIRNAAPQSIMLGISDKSTRPLPIEAEAIPSHLVKVIHFAKWGPTEEDQLLGGNGFGLTYHVDSLDQRKKWANHATELLSGIYGTGSVAVTRRVVPKDAPKPAAVRVYMDVLPVTKQLFIRNADGSIKVDKDGVPVPAAGTVPGFKVKFVKEAIDIKDGVNQFGLGTIKAGDQKDTDTQTQSQRYPFFDAEVPHQGEHGNNQGLRMWAPTLVSQDPVDTRLLTSIEAAYPIRMACVSRTSTSSTGSIVASEDGEQYIDVCLKPGAQHPATTQDMYVGDRFIQSYETLNDPAAMKSWGPFGKFKLYDANVATLLAMFYEAEKDQLVDFSDFKGDDGEEYRFNILGGQTSGGVPYATFELVTGASDSIRLTEASTIYAEGGGDGTMNNATFAALVSEQMVRYANPADEMTNMSMHPEKFFYDTGFPLATKYDLLNFIGYRKDTFVGLATYEVGTPKLTASAESALGMALVTRARTYPDSEYFGTPVVRAGIWMRHGRKIGSQFKGDLPVIHEWVIKASRYMGASTGIWNSTYAFDSGTAAEVNMFADINVTFTPGEVRNKDWANGLNWVEAKGRKTAYFPASRTVYDNDTSVLTSIFTAAVCSQVQAIANQVRIEFSGESRYSDLELVDKINKRVIALTEGRFDGRVTIIPKAYITAADAARGFSWTLPIQVYAANMKTVGTISVESYRNEDLVQ